MLADLLGAEFAVGVEELLGVLAGLDKFDKSPEAAAEAVQQALAGDAKRTQAVMDLAARLGEPGGLLERPAAAPLRECVDALGAMGLGGFVDVDFRIVRGLAYYTGVVFELFDAGRSLRALCGGGRYDALLEQIGGVNLPMVGFGMGDVVLGELIGDRDGPPAAASVVQVFVATVGDDDRPAALFEDLFYTSLNRFREQQGMGARKAKFRFKNKLLSLDSTTISLCLDLFP